MSRRSPRTPPFCTLIIESKQASVSATAGLPQLLAYCSSYLAQQPTVWGLATNGADYLFVRFQNSLQSGNCSSYQPLPPLNLLNWQGSYQLLQVLKALCRGIAASTP